MGNIYHERKSPRANWHEYDGGDYFVTICTKDKFHYFGEIKNDEIKLTDIGIYLKSQIENIQKYYPFAEVLLYTIMPNHIHLIISICTDAIHRVHTSDAIHRVHTAVNTNDTAIHRVHNNDNNDTMDAINRVPTSARNVMKKQMLGSVIRGLKARVTKYANDNKIQFAWLGRYNDRIIRNKNEMNRIAEYITNNPIKWKSN
ncbi:MAG: hypothetical protein IKY27_04230 [Bacteroidales bacterium]|nr:hypothetical protein [Bacteroidales bacterium]